MSETEMGDLVIETIEESVVDPVLEMINDTVNSTASEAKTSSTPEGMAIAYGSLVFMALLPIFLGSFRFVGAFLLCAGKHWHGNLPNDSVLLHIHCNCIGDWQMAYLQVGQARI